MTCFRSEEMFVFYLIFIFSSLLYFDCYKVQIDSIKNHFLMARNHNVYGALFSLPMFNYLAHYVLI